MNRFAASAALLAITSATVEARDLWSLYVYEQTVSECGLQLTEDQEDDLDAAQLRARVALALERCPKPYCGTPLSQETRLPLAVSRLLLSQS